MQVGREVEVLVATGEGRKDADTARMTGRARDNRLVHFRPADDAPLPRPGDFVTAEITYAAPHHLVADRGATAPRRTRAGEAWEAARAPAAGASSGSGDGASVLLGMPQVGARG
jgi:tRNA-2-methylthio-N6-dimethylallyladenosine synthase